MSKKQLLTESEIRRFMKLANLEPLANGVVKESWQQQDESKMEETSHQMDEAGLSGADEAAPQADEAPTPPAAEMDSEEGGEEEGGSVADKLEMHKDEIAKLIGVDPSELSFEVSEGEEDDMDMEMSDEDEGEDEEEEEDEKAEDKEEMDETLSEDALVETVLARVTARLVAEASKKKMPKGLKDAMKKKQQEKEAKKDGEKKPAAKKESLELKGDKLEEATSAEGGGPLLKQGKNKFDVYKGHADMTYAKGKEGKGGHQMETMTAKSEHTVTHGGKNLATMGGNKKKV